MQTRKLGTSPVEVTRVGLGTAPLAGMYEPVGDETARATVEAALAGGIGFFDTAPWYGLGRGEQRLGAALRGEASHHVVSTKVGRLLTPAPERSPSDPEPWPEWPEKLPFEPRFDYGYSAIRQSFEDSLQRLGLPRVDVLFLHDLGRVTHGDAHERHFQGAMEGGVRALCELRDEGLIGAIGIGVNEVEVLMEALDVAHWDAFLLAGRYTLLEQEEALAKLFPACERAKTSIIVGGAFNSGLLAGGGTYNYADAPRELIQRRDALRAICELHGVTLEAAALQFPLAHPAVASLLIGCRRPEEVTANLEHLAAPIPMALWDQLRSEGLLLEGAPVPAAG